jgi:MoaA/NifB/PqqE/SkfB family radical SAM enzyme
MNTPDPNQTTGGTFPTAEHLNQGHISLDERELLSQLSIEARRDALGVDLTKYAGVWEKPFEKTPLVSRTNRSVAMPVAKGMFKKAIGLVPDPVMLTHILTTRCNYSCGFCSFADSLNNKTDELSLDEIELTYRSMGNALNTIVYSGGETTLHPQMAEIVEAAYRSTHVQSVYIISNAWKPDKLIELTHHIMQRCPGLHLTWSLSIEGFKAHNNSVRHTRNEAWDAWQNTIDTMFALQQMREAFGYTYLNAQLCTVCTPENHESMPSWYTFIRDVLKPDKWNLNLMRRSVQMTESELPHFSERREQATLQPFEKTYVAITEQVAKDARKGALQFAYTTETPLEGAMKSAVDLISQEENRRTLQQQPKQFQCKAGTIGAYISANGLVSGCEEFAHNPNTPKVYGSLREHHYDFKAIWNSRNAKRLRQLTDCSTECLGCTLESQRNYPAILLSPKTLRQAYALGKELMNPVISAAEE